MNPGAEKLPTWVQAVAPLILIAFIVTGGFWLKRMEAKAREEERRRKESLGDVSGEK